MSSPFDTHPDRIRIPLSQKVVRGLELDRELRDDTIIPDRTLLVSDGEEALKGDERLISMGEMIVERDGGSLRTFAGNLAHENGWWPSLKRRRLQHWEGETQRQALMALECDFSVEWAQSEPCLLRFPIGDEWFEWYADIHVSRFDAPEELWEIKKDERQLEDPRYRLKLAGAREICRRIGWRFRLVMADEIAINRHHRDNVELFASRRRSAPCELGGTPSARPLPRYRLNAILLVACPLLAHPCHRRRKRFGLPGSRLNSRG